LNLAAESIPFISATSTIWLPNSSTWRNFQLEICNLQKLLHWKCISDVN
jgi:hypothetical protein